MLLEVQPKLLRTLEEQHTSRLSLAITVNTALTFVVQQEFYLTYNFTNRKGLHDVVICSDTLTDIVRNNFGSDDHNRCVMCRLLFTQAAADFQTIHAR